MAVRETLVLDHFYVNASVEEFDDLKRLLELIPGGSSHQVVKTDNDGWEGLYFYDRAGGCFEILRARREGALGIAFVSSSPFHVETSRITTELELPWTLFSRNDSTGAPWFDSHSLTPDQTSLKNLFHAWIMDYKHRHVASAHAPKVPRTIDQLKSLKLTLGRDHADEIENLARWFPILPLRLTDGFLISVPARDGYRFNIEINFVDGSERFKWNEIAFRLYETPSFTEFSMGSFTALVSGRDVVLRRT